jgi:hypothetical protein
MKDRDHYEDLDVDGKIMLQWILKEYGVDWIHLRITGFWGFVHRLVFKKHKRTQSFGNWVFSVLPGWETPILLGPLERVIASVL